MPVEAPEDVSEQLSDVPVDVAVVPEVSVVPEVAVVPVVSVVSPVLSVAVSVVSVPVSVDGAFVEAVEAVFDTDLTLAALGAAAETELLGGMVETPLEVALSQEHSEV